MAYVTRAINSIISGDTNFCCLCFKLCTSEELICSKDEACVTLKNNVQENILMSDLILTILGNNFTEYVEIFECICEDCAKCLINSYTFIQTCNSNAAVLSSAINSLNNVSQSIMKPEQGHSLFISINLTNLSSRILYDVEKITTPTVALNRFQDLSTKETEVSKTRKKKAFQMTDSEMLLDPSCKNILTCKECLKVYNCIANLRNHFVRVHTEKNYKCSKCPRTYCSKALAKAHQAVSHHKAMCQECGKIFKNLHSLKMHRIGHNMTLVCPDCGRTYKNKTTYRKHKELNICKQERRHSPSGAKYTCDYCGKKYTQKMSLRVHIQFEHGNYKAHICEWCGKKFWAQSRLKAHIVKHTQEKNFKCTICNGKFVTRESLLYHTRLHTGEKPYKCPECSSRFLSASRRSDHVKRYHTGAKPGLECDVCHGKFRSGNVLIKHKRTHEETNPSPVNNVGHIKKKRKVDKEDSISYITEINSISNKNDCVDKLFDNQFSYIID